MPERFFTQPLANGLMLLGQPMDNVSSAAMAMLVPAGASHDPDGLEGAAYVATEWRLRGAAQRDSRQLNDALDSLGIDHDESVLSAHLEFSMAQLGANLPQAIELLADIVLRPRFEDDTFDPCRDLTLQDLASLEDEPARKCNILLRERFFPYPLGRNILGSEQSLAAMTPQAVRSHCTKIAPHDAILAVAGNFDWPKFVEMAKRSFGDWSAKAPAKVNTKPIAGGLLHVKKDSAQQHIALAHNAVPMGDARSYQALMAEKVLSGGMSGRLFTEVREKRGLVYHVSTRYASMKSHAGFFTYAGTRPQVAQETLDVTVGELKRLSEGISHEEMTRARTQLKSALVMQGESTVARAHTLAADWYHLNRLRGLHEISAAVDNVTASDVIDYLRQFPAGNFTILTVGPEELDISAING